MDPILTKYVREPNSFTLDFYLQHEGYEALKLAFTKKPDEIIEMVKASGLRDRLLRDRRENRLHLHSGRVPPRAGHPRARDRRGLSARLPRQEHPRLRLRLRRLHASGRRRVRGR